MFCYKCGAEIETGDKFCSNCGRAAPFTVNKEKSSGSAGEGDKASGKGASLNPAVVSVYEPVEEDLSGEEIFTTSLVPSPRLLITLPPSVPSPFKIIAEGVAALWERVKRIPKDMKKLIPAVILAALWITLFTMRALGFDPAPVRLLSWLTFERGGMSADIAHIAGGVIGRAVYAVFFISLWSGGIKNTGTGILVIISAFKIAKRRKISLILAGAGCALIFYNFAAGNAEPVKSMAAIVPLLLVSRALGGGGGFISSMAESVTAKKTGAVRLPRPEAQALFLTGLAAGFALGVMLSFIPWGYTPYIAGIAAFAAALVIVIVYTVKKPV